MPCIVGLHCHHHALGHLAIPLHSLETIKLLDVFEVDLEAISFPEVVVILFDEPAKGLKEGVLQM